MKYSELKNLIKESVQKELLKEENSINREIEEAAEQIYGFVMSHHFTENEKSEENNDFVSYKFDKIFKFFNTKIFAYFEFRKYKDESKVIDCDSTSTTSSGRGATMIIQYNSTKGSFSCGELYDSIQHELTHIFNSENLIGQIYPFVKSNYIKGIMPYDALEKLNFDVTDDFIKEFANMMKAFQKFLLNSGMRVNGNLNNLTLSMFF